MPPRRRERPVFGFGVKVKVIRARVSQGSSFLHIHRAPRYHVALEVDGRKERTVLSHRGEQPRWEQVFNLQGSNLSKLRICLFQEKTLQTDLLLGEISIGMETLVTYDDGDPRELELSGNTKARKPYYVTIMVSMLKEASLAAKIYQAVAIADEQVGGMRQLALSGGDLSVADGVVAIGQDAWPLLMGRLSAFVKLVDEVSEIHPYAKLAWDVTTVAYKLIRDQMSRDARIDQLATTVWESYEFVADAEPLNAVKTCQKQIQALAQQTVECAYFIRGYTKFSSFTTRLLVNIASGVDDTIQQFEDSFKQIQLSLQQRTTLESALTVMRISAKVERIADDIVYLVLNEMSYHRGARYITELASSPTLHSQTVDLLAAWINSPWNDVPRLWLLTGEDRSELSAMASQICIMFDRQNRLASSFFCSNGRDPTYPEHVLGTMGRNLADYDDNIKLKLYESLRKNRSLSGTKSPEEQFSAFIAGPLKSCEVDWENQLGPSVIVIDSLDLCGDAPSRKNLLAVLFGRIHELPTNFRVIVTSLAANDIVERFKMHSGAHSNISSQNTTKPLIWTQLLVGQHCLQSAIAESVSATLLSMKNLYSIVYANPGGVHLYAKTALSLLMNLEAKFTHHVYTDKSGYLVPLMQSIDRLIGTIPGRAEHEESNTFASTLKPALQAVSEALYLVDALNRIDFDKKEMEAAIKEIEGLLNQARDLLSAKPPKPPQFHPIHSVRPRKEPPPRNCHPMFFSELTCQSSTRSDVVQSVLEWAYNTIDETLPRICLLSGNPGSGKTSIAHALTQHFMSEDHLAWAFFHEICGKAECKELLFSAASGCIVDPSLPIQVPVKSDKPPPMTEQLQEFFKAASRYENLGIVGPVVFVFDGLDQSFPSSTVKDLIEIFENDASHLPPNIRLLITCSPDTAGLISLAPLAVHIHMKSDGRVKEGGKDISYDDGGHQADDTGDGDDLDNQNAVVKFNTRITERNLDYTQDLIGFMREHGLAETKDGHAGDVTKKLGGDFRVASVLSSLMSKGRLSASDLYPSGKAPDLGELYTRELQSVFPLDDLSKGCEEEGQRLFEFRFVMGQCTIASQKTLLGLDFFDEIPNHEGRSSDPKATAFWLSQLSGVAKVGSQNLIHIKQTFQNYLFNPSKPHRYSVSIEQCQPYVSLACILVMLRQLQGAVSSPDYNDFLSLKYASQEWSGYLQYLPSPLPKEFCDALETFLTHSTLRWAEFLNRLGLIMTAVRSIRALIAWLRERPSFDNSDTVASLLKSASDAQDTLGGVFFEGLPDPEVVGVRIGSKISQRVEPTANGSVCIDERRNLQIAVPIAKQDVRFFEFSDSGDRVAVREAKYRCHIWNVTNNKKLCTIPNVDNEAIKFVNNDKHILVTTRRGWKLCNVDKGSVVHEFTHTHNIAPVVMFSAQGKIAANLHEQGVIKFWDPSDFTKPQATATGLVKDFAWMVFFDDDQKLIVRIRNKDLMQIFRVNDGALLDSFEKRDSVWAQHV